MDPGTGPEAFELARRRRFFQIIAGPHRAQTGILRKPPVELAQERKAVLRIIFPAVFPVENDGNHVRAAGGFFIELQTVLNLVKPADEIGGGSGRLPSRIGEADGVGEFMIAKENMEGASFLDKLV